MEEQPRRRRNSIERYQPKNNTDADELSDKLQSTTLTDQGDTQGNQQSYCGSSQQNRNQRRGVNSHLFGKNNQNNSNRNNQNRSRQNYQQQDHSSKQSKGWGGRSDTEKVNFNPNAAEQRPYHPPHKQQQINEERGFSPRKKNTETFTPSHKPTDMRILTGHASWKKYNREVTSRDVLIINDLFCEPDDLTIYNKLLDEIKNSGIEGTDLWQLWHGDSHLIADDKKKWKEACPTFHLVLNKIRDYFDMDIKATRLNWYRDSTEWKPFHHDAAAIKPDKAKTQNFTVAVSFGAEREAAFEHASTKTVISMPQPNGTIYVFSKDVNVIWRHGILQVPPDKYHDRGRISIIAWGWVTQTGV